MKPLATSHAAGPATMSTSSRHSASGRLKTSPPPAMAWQSWPLRDEPVWGAAILVGVAAVGLFVRWTTGRLPLAILAMGLLGIGLARFLLPVTWEIGPTGIRRRRWGRRRQIPWPAVGRYEIHTDGVLLLPEADGRPLESLRGVYLGWGPQRDAVLAQLEFYLGPPADRR